MLVEMFPKGKEVLRAWVPNLLEEGAQSKGPGFQFIRSETNKIGTVLVEFLALSIGDKSSFESFVERFGLTLFAEYLFDEYLGDVYNKWNKRDDRSRWGAIDLLYEQERDIEVYPGTHLNTLFGVNGNPYFPEALDALHDWGALELSLDDLNDLREELWKNKGRLLETEKKALLREMVKDWFDDGEEWARDLTPIQRYYYKPHPCFFDVESQVKKYACPVMMKKNSADLEAKNDTVNVSEMSLGEYRKLISDHQVHFIDKYFFNDVFVFCCIEIKEMLKLGRTLRRCQYCDNYFLPERSDAIYCHRNQKPTGYKVNGKIIAGWLTCHDLGPQKAYKEQVRNDPLKMTYQRAYKRNYAKLDHAEFDDWKKEAKAQLLRVKAKKMTVEEFDNWTWGKRG